MTSVSLIAPLIQLWLRFGESDVLKAGIWPAGRWVEVFELVILVDGRLGSVGVLLRRQRIAVLDRGARQKEGAPKSMRMW
jgi:hypothetical protein